MLLVGLVEGDELVALVAKLVNQCFLVLRYSMQIDVLAFEHIFNLLLLSQLQSKL